MTAVLTLIGRQFLVKRLGTSNGLSIGSGWYVGWGIGAGSFTQASTTLSTETTSAAGGVGRVVPTISSPASDTLRLSAVLTADGGKTITNVGAFDAVSSGNLVLAYNVASIVLSLNDTLTIIFDLQFT